MRESGGAGRRDPDTHVRRLATLPPALLLALAIAPSGCSVLLAKGPPANHESMRFFDCNTSKAPMVLDTLIAVPAVLVAGAAMSSHQNSDSDAAAAVVYAVGFGASAIYGYNAATECQEAQAKLVERMDRHERLIEAIGKPSGRQPAWRAPSPWDAPAGSGGETKDAWDPWTHPAARPAPSPPAESPAPPKAEPLPEATPAPAKPEPPAPAAPPAPPAD